MFTEPDEGKRYYFIPRRRRNDDLVTLHSSPDCGGLKVAMRFYEGKDLKIDIPHAARQWGKAVRVCQQTSCK